MEVLFKKENNDLIISVGNSSFLINLDDVKVNNDELALFLTDLAANFIKEEFKYTLEPAELVNDQRVKLLVELIEKFVKTFQEEFNNISATYEKEIKNIKTNINI